MVSFEDIIIASKRNYSKISFDVAKIKNDAKLRNTYKINPEEKIIAYLKLGLLYPLSSFGNIITEQAIYSNPAVSGDTNRFAYSNLHQYVVIKKSEKDGVILVGTDGIFTINGGSLLQNNTSGDELVTLITKIQQELFKSSEIVEERISEIKIILQNIRQEFCHGSVPVYYEQFKNSIYAENICSDDFIYLDAEIAFRNGNHSQCINLINKTSDKTNNYLERYYENFAQSYINDLSNILFDFAQDYIKKVYTNLCQVTTDHKYYSLIFAYVCVRHGDRERYSLLKESVTSKLGTEIAVELETFKQRYANKQMLDIYKMISSDEIPKKEILENTDSLGLNPMHYALILQKDAIIENLLKEQNKFSKCELSEDDDAFPCYNIAIIACLLNLNKKNDIISAVSSGISQKAQIKARFDKELVLLQTSKAAQNKIINQYQKILHQVRTDPKYAQVDDSKIEEMNIKIETAEENLEKLEDHIADLEDKIHDIQGEIDDIISDEMAEYMDQVEDLLTSDNPFVQMLIDLYQNPDMLYNILSYQENDQRLYEYNNFNFIMPPWMELNLPYTSCENSSQKNPPSCAAIASPTSKSISPKTSDNNVANKLSALDIRSLAYGAIYYYLTQDYNKMITLSLYSGKQLSTPLASELSKLQQISPLLLDDLKVYFSDLSKECVKVLLKQVVSLLESQDIVSEAMKSKIKDLDAYISTIKSTV